MNIDELIATAQPRTEQVRICARGDLVAAHEAAVRALDQAQREDDSLAGPQVTELAQRITEIEAEQDAATVEFTVAAVSRRVWADLLAQHPPSKEQRRLGHAFDPEPFSVSMVAACVVEPSMTREKAQQLSEVLHQAEWAKLENTAFRLNITETPHPKLPAATALLLASDASSTTQVNGASLAAGSLAGSGEQ